jgi:GH15 family glucan-1,4-alpha-glucosidase
MESLQSWLDREYHYAAKAMLRSVSAVDIVKARPGFGQTMRPAKGSVIASPVPGAYDPDPDYFFHWFRDSAVVIDAIRLLHEDGVLGAEAIAHLRDFVRFSESLGRLDGRKLVADRTWRSGVIPSFEQYVREDADLAAVHGETVVGDTRVNPDGTLDISRWARPQHDGPPLRALALLAWLRSGKLSQADSADVWKLARADIEFTQAHWNEPSYDIWEEELGQHYYTLRVSAQALSEGAAWAQSHGDSELAEKLAPLWSNESAAIRTVLDGFWMEDAGHYRSRVLAGGARSKKELDIALVLSAIHALSTDKVHSVRDPRMHATLERLEALFEVAYPINHRRPANRAPAMGRYDGDVYYSGGAYYFSTFGAAEFCYRAAAALKDRSWFARGEAYFETIRAYTPESGDLSEQFDQKTGAQTSAKHLAWSYAAFISTYLARRAVTE